MNKAGKLFAGSIIAFVSMFVFMTGCVFRTARPEKVDVWPPAVAWEKAAKSKPSVRLVFKEAVQTSFMLDSEYKSTITRIGNMSMPNFRLLMKKKLVESGLFRAVTTDPGAKTDIVVEASYIESAGNFGWLGILGAFTIGVIPIHLDSQNMVSIKVLEGTRPRGEASSFERSHLYFWLPLFPFSLVDQAYFESNYVDAAPEKMIEAALANAMEQKLFQYTPPVRTTVRKKKKRVRRRGPYYYGRVYMTLGTRVIVRSSLSRRLRKGSVLSVFSNRRVIGKIKVLAPYETRFDATFLSGSSPSRGMLVGYP